jgi:hypothetical protein
MKKLKTPIIVVEDIEKKLIKLAVINSDMAKKKYNYKRQ